MSLRRDVQLFLHIVRIFPRYTYLSRRFHVKSVVLPIIVINIISFPFSIEVCAQYSVRGSRVEISASIYTKPLYRPLRIPRSSAEEFDIIINEFYYSNEKLGVDASSNLYPRIPKYCARTSTPEG